MKLKKRRKSKLMRGTRLHGHAAKKRKGSGNRGGKGMAGTGKRADQRKTYVIKYMYPYFGRKGRIREKKALKDKRKKINLGDIEKNLKSYIEEGVAKNVKDEIEVNLPNYKILGDGEISKKFVIKAASFSKHAKEKIEKAGGKTVSLTTRKD